MISWRQEEIHTLCAHVLHSSRGLDSHCAQVHKTLHSACIADILCAHCCCWTAPTGHFWGAGGGIFTWLTRGNNGSLIQCTTEGLFLLTCLPTYVLLLVVQGHAIPVLHLAERQWFPTPTFQSLTFSLVCGAASVAFPTTCHDVRGAIHSSRSAPCQHPLTILPFCTLSPTSCRSLWLRLWWPHFFGGLLQPTSPVPCVTRYGTPRWQIFSTSGKPTGR